MHKKKKEAIVEVYKVNQYGKVIGLFKLRYNELVERSNDKQYFYNEIKEQYYKLYFDIDYHYKYSFIQDYNDYTNKIIDVIISILNKIFINPDTLYIYGKKDTGNGVHLYFYNLIVTQEIHTYILNEIYLYFMNIEKILLKHIKQIIDYHVICNGTLRLFYFNFKNGYYYPSVEQSTYNLLSPNTSPSDDKKKYLMYSIVKTNKKMHNNLSPYYYNIVKNKNILFYCKEMLPRL